jgi:hypothetical protein
MRPFGTLIEKAIKFRQPSIPGPRMDRVVPRTENRLDRASTSYSNMRASPTTWMRQAISWH